MILSKQVPQLLALDSDECKQINYVNQFKSNLKNSICTNFASRLFKRFVPNLRFSWDIQLFTVSSTHKIHGVALSYRTKITYNVTNIYNVSNITSNNLTML